MKKAESKVETSKKGKNPTPADKAATEEIKKDVG